MKKLNKKGFTIVELVIVIAVIGILAGVLIPVFTVVVKKANQSAAIQALDTARKEYMTEVDNGADDFSDFDIDVTYKYLVDKKGTDFDNLYGFWKYSDGEWDQVDAAYRYTLYTTGDYDSTAFYCTTKGGAQKTFADATEFNTFVASNPLYIRSAATIVADAEAANNNIEIYK